ncbi:MAG: hypothetical protein QXF56_00625 [Candidatus Micrarchaeia archaeon]
MQAQVKADPLIYVKRIEEVKGNQEERVKEIEGIIAEYTKRGGSLRDLRYYLSLQSEDRKVFLQPERKGYCEQLKSVENLDVALLLTEKRIKS